MRVSFRGVPRESFAVSDFGGELIDRALPVVAAIVFLEGPAPLLL